MFVIVENIMKRPVQFVVLNMNDSLTDQQITLYCG